MAKPIDWRRRLHRARTCIAALQRRGVEVEGVHMSSPHEVRPMIQISTPDAPLTGAIGKSWRIYRGESGESEQCRMAEHAGCLVWWIEADADSEPPAREAA